MDQLERSLTECVTNLQSTKINERKKSVLDLQEIMQKNEAIEVINKISLNNRRSQLTWNSLFIISHNALLQEVDKSHHEGRKLKSRGNLLNSKMFHASLVSTVVAKANNTDTPYLDFDSVIDAAVYVLENPMYRDKIGNNYVNMLRQQVLPIQQYWNKMKLQHWIDLFELAKNLEENPPTKCGLSVIIEMTNLIIKYGCEHSSFTVVLKKRKIFSFLQKVVQDAIKIKDTDLHFNTIVLLVTACEKLQKECRMAICTFGEEIIDKLLDMYEAKVEGAFKKTQMMIEFLLIIVQAHHPNGVTEKSIKSYANNWNKWKHTLNQLNYIIICEIDFVQKYSKLQHITASFLKLVVEIYNQIFSCSQNFIENSLNYSVNEANISQEIIISKRKRIICGFSDILYNLNNVLKPVEMWPWLAILSNLISTYPSLVDASDYMSLLQNMSKFLLISKEPIVMENLCRCCISLIDLRQSQPFESKDVLNEDIIWDSIWNIILRTIGLNQNVEWSHALLRRLISFSWKPEYGNSILTLYSSHVVHFSEHSLLTLYNLRQHISFPDSILNISVYSSLLRWLVPLSDDFSNRMHDFYDISHELYAHLVVLVCIKNNCKKPYKYGPILNLDGNINTTKPVSTSFIYEMTSCESETLLVQNISEKQIIECESENCVLNNDAIEQLLNLLEQIQTIEIYQNRNDQLSNIQYLASSSLFLLHIVTLIEYYKLTTYSARLLTLLEKVTVELFSLTENVLAKETDINKVRKVLKMLLEFFKRLGVLPSFIIEHTVKTFFPQLLYVFEIVENVFNKFEMEDDMELQSSTKFESISLFDINDLCSHDKIKVEACQLLLYYSYNYDKICECQHKVLIRILEILIESKENGTICFLQMCVYSIQTVLLLKNINSKIYINSTFVIRALCSTEKYFMIEESVVIILKLIQGCLKNICHEDTESWENLKILINGMQELLSSTGIRVTTEIIHCLGIFMMVSFDYNCLWNVSQNTDNVLLLICKDIFTYLNHPSHEIRVTTISYLPKIFQLTDHFVSNELLIIDVEPVFQKFLNALWNIFNVDELTNEEIDENINRPLTVLYSLACAICYNKVARRKLIFSFFNITFEKRIRQDLAYKILEIIKSTLKLNDVKDLIHDNFLYTCWHWYKKYDTFENFPFGIIHCASIKEFYGEFLKDIVVVLLFCGEINKLNSLSCLLENSLLNIFKTCFAEVIALVLRQITSNKDSSSENEGISANEIHQVVVNTFGSVKFEEQMIHRLPNTLTSILRNLHDPTFRIPKYSILPLPTVFVSDKNSVEKMISYLQFSAGINSPSMLIYIAQNYPHFIQKIFQKLYIYVLKATTSEMKLHSFQGYALFCELLFPYYKNLLDCKLIVFVTTTILNNLLSFISTDLEDIPMSLCVLKLFQEFITKWISNDQNYLDSILVFKEYFGSIVEKLVPLASANNILALESLNILHRLLIERAACFFESIAKLDRLPDLPQFDSLRAVHLEMQQTQTDAFSLKTDIERFLNTEKKYSNSLCRVESLKYLRKQLSLYKAELHDMCKNLINKNWFSENYISNILYQLILSLLQMNNFQNEKIKYEAVCCIGEIGLINLNTVVLQPNDDVYHSDSDPEILIIKALFEILKACIVDNDVIVVNTACAILYTVLYTKKGVFVLKESSSELEKLILYPFVTRSTDKLVETNVWHFFYLEKFKKTVNDESLWLPMDNISYNVWIVNLVCAILESFNRKYFLYSIQMMCRIKVSFAENIFKYLVYLLVSCDNCEPKNILGERINQFFENYCNSYISNRSTGNPAVCSMSSVQCLLDVIHFIRLNERNSDSNVLNINYLFAAKAAQYCSAYFTSILYAELWINSQIKNCDVSYDGNVSLVLEEIGISSSENQNELLNVLREAFSKISDSDAFYGCVSSLLMRPESRILHYQQMENWQRVIETCNSQLISNFDSNARINDLSSAIGFSGFNYIQNHYLSSLDQLNPQLSDALYESGWKLGKWDLKEPSNDHKTFCYFQYTALKDIHQNNYEGARLNVQNARYCLIPLLDKLGFESTKNIYQILAQLQCLQDIEDFINTNDINKIIANWKYHDSLCTGISFHHKEIIFNQRIRMMDIDSEIGKNFVLNVAKVARKEQNFTMSEVCLALIKNKNAIVFDLFDLKVILEEARLLWDRKETYVARYLLKELLKKSDPSNITFHSILLRTYGKWLSEINLENAETILDNYFLPSSEMLKNHVIENGKERKSRFKTYKCVAEFADFQYQQISTYIKSDVFGELIMSVNESKKQSEALGEETFDMRKKKQLLSNQSKVEGQQVREIQSKENRYLTLAMRYYLKILAECEEEDIKIFRIISFWLHNKNHVQLHKEIRECMFQIPSYKFVLVLPQLMAHITRNSVEYFAYSLNKIIEKCIVEHPHHTLPLILSVANYIKDDYYENIKKSARNVANEERVLAAIEYINKFRSCDTVGMIVKEMEILFEAYIQFAYFKTDKKMNPGEVVSIPAKQNILKIKNFENICCPTITLPVKKNSNYLNIIGIFRIETNFITACGVSAPKKIMCVCTDGEIRYQLVKGQDDLRVDAVMQQVFTIMNKLLSRNKGTSKRKLLIRTYKVVPLSQKSGVLEFCMNTISLSEYLIWKDDRHPGAHYRFRPNDMRTDEARISMAKNHANRCSDEKKYRNYQEICKKLKPVFRYFFIEKFPLPTVWFERKLAYIHSVAVTSMVGYILGIGDRHVQNMLIDEKTAEIIHIDFGIAFDQGLTLNCPEQIPFRLTRDIEDGMGIFSIDGVFRRCCERTLTVLRENSDIIRTTIEVFIHDPLYQWTLTPEKKASLQNISDKNINHSLKGIEKNITASRALSRIKLKLEGLEEGTTTSVEGQVNRLIQQAKDAENLSKLFHGWQAYL